MKKRVYALLLVLAMLAAALCGCASSEAPAESAAPAEQSVPAEQSAPAEQPAPAEEAAPAEESIPAEEPAPQTAAEKIAPGWVYEPITYPLENPDDVSFTYWMVFDLSPDTEIGTMDNHPVVKKLKEITGVSLELIVNSQYTGTEKTNLMYASGEYPDLISGFSYTSGTEAAIEDEIIFDMKEMLPKYCPDYWQYLRDDAIYKAVATDNGAIGTFAGIGTPSRGPGEGLMVRQDWMDALNLETPVTFDDFEQVLMALKTEYEPADPLWLTLDGVLNNDLFCGSFGVKLKVNSMGSTTSGFYIEDDEIKFGYLEQGLKDYLEVMSKWYSEGLISKEFTTHITEMRDEGMIEAILTGKTAIFSRGDGLIDMFNKRGSGEGYNVVAIPDPVVAEGDIIPFGYRQETQAGSGMAMTTQCEYPELAMQWINYWYTDEGFILGTYGLEGVSFEYDESGEPQYTELLTNNPNGRPLTSMKQDYTGVVQLRTDNSRPEASYSQQAQDAPIIWASNRSGDGELPSNISMTAEEGEEFTVIFSDITTYCAENIVRFIIGDAPLSEVDAFQEQIKSMNIERCFELWQQAIDRYNAR